MAEERADKSIEEMEAEADVEVPAPKEETLTDEENEWKGEKRKKDQFSDRDAEPRVKIYTLSVPNKAAIDGVPNQGYHKLCLDRDYSILPREIIRCVVLHRTLPKIAQIPYKKQDSIPKDEPWKKYLGYSFNGVSPEADSTGHFMQLCQKDGVPYKICSLPTRYKDNEVVREALKDGECPWGKWGNSMKQEDIDKIKGITEESNPVCNDQIVLYCWDIDVMVPFIAFFKVTSIGSAKDFIASCSRGIGDDIIEYPFHAFEAQISIVDKGEYVIPKIINTNKYMKKKHVTPLVRWFEEQEAVIVRNLARQMEEAKKRKAKKDKATDFNPADYES